LENPKWNLGSGARQSADAFSEAAAGIRGGSLECFCGAINWAGGRRISHCLENSQSEIPHFVRNDKLLHGFPVRISRRA
jgi:hypothetical protein